ncbi:vWA domain-containing protein [Litchfieldia alkalitelluris]|uniref:VWA domain-containing protein n=2 Tax=Evansella alkalicola TaxID=745819 RepID=A0ABS6JQB2_9BACI|nr:MULTISPECIES: VWA domain-containing protein [Bacillaceae]MBU9720625.1 VWA domain-containing protein [Bacillus alkalicola]
MGILYPIFFSLSIFIGGLIILYMFRKQYENLEVSTNLLWVQIMNEWNATTWWRKLQKQLLLLLQILIFTLLILSLVRPYNVTDRVAGDHVILMIDTSATMAVLISESEERELSRFDKAKSDIQELITSLQRGQSVSIITIGDSPSLVVNRETDLDSINKIIEELELSFEHRNYNRALSLAYAISQEDSASIHVYSDQITEDDLGQFYWKHPIHVNNYTGGENNISIVTFGIQENHTNQDQTISAIATIKNHSDITKEVNFTINGDDGETSFETNVEINAEDEAYITIDDLPQSSFYHAYIDSNDSFLLDNDAYAISSIRPDPTLYLIGDINPFLERVLVYLDYAIVYGDDINKMDDFEDDSIVIFSGDHVPIIERPTLILTNHGSEPSSEIEWADVRSDIAINDSELFNFVDVSDLFISRVGTQTKMDVSNSSTNVLKEQIMLSGDLPLIEEGTNNGNSFVHVKFDLQESDWPLHPSFPIFIYNTLESLSGQATLNLGYLLPGEERMITNNLTEGTLHIQNQNNVEVGYYEPSKDVFRAPRQPGIYSLVDHNQQHTYFAVTIDEREKDTRGMNSFSLTADNEDESIGTTYYEWWPWLLLFVIVLLIIEWEVYRRGIRI